MLANKKNTIKKILTVSVWFILVSGVVVLLIAAMSKKKSDKISGIEIKISGVQNHYFIDKNEVQQILEKVNGKKLAHSPSGSLNLTSMEMRLLKEDWIKKAELFFDNNRVLQVRITEREPIARIFTVSGTSFYIDSSLSRLPLSEKFSARLPVFTGFPTEVKVLKKKDSVLLNGIKNLSEYINANPFWMAQIDQIDITSQNDFEMIPKLGNQVIRFGDASEYMQKFARLLAFYQKVEQNIGWNKYSVLDVRFKNQVIGVLRDAAEIKSDSLKTIEIMQKIISEAEKNSNDSTKIQLIQPEERNERVNQSPVLDEVPAEKIEQKDEETKEKITPVKKPEEARPSVKEQKRTESIQKKKPAATVEKRRVSPAAKTIIKTKKAEQKRAPKAVMPPKSDY
jgi:cell division protein FtsQ